MRSIGFTGTQRGMTTAQAALFGILLKRLTNTATRGSGVPVPFEFHHGDCVGADAQVHAIVAAGAGERTIVVHPPTDAKKRAFTDGPVAVDGLVIVTKSARPYLDRNHDIVDESDVLIAAPKEQDEVRRSGTWATIRYAVQQDKPVYVLCPLGGWIAGSDTVQPQRKVIQ